MSILFLTNSVLTTLQDTGRNDFRHLGINPNGAMDKSAARLINILLGNSETEGVLEMHFPAPKILFEQDAVIALGGAHFDAKIGDGAIENWQIVRVKKGDVLSFERKRFGSRLYLAIRGGFRAEKWLGSFSTNLKAQIGGFDGRALRKNDRIFFESEVQTPKLKARYRISNALIPNYSYSPTIRVVSGAEWQDLTAESRESFLRQSFAIRTESDRMGFRLRGELLNLCGKIELVSSAVNFGTIQLLPDGELIILMADHQTIGGYPRIAHIVGADLSLVAQLGANDKLNFELISLAEAEDLMIKFEKELDWLRVGCRLKNNAEN